MDVKTIPLNQEYSSSFMSVFHYSQDNLYVGIDEYSKDKVSEFKIHYPDNTFANYYTILSVSKGDESWSYQKFGSIPSEFRKFEATIPNLSFTANRLVGIKTGDCDYFFAALSSTLLESGNEYSLEWTVNLSGVSNSLDTKLPIIPTQIIERYPRLKSLPEKKLRYASVNEMDYIDGYEEYVTSLFGPKKYTQSTDTEFKAYRIAFH